MCIVFLWRQKETGIQSVGKYKLILAANRDESFDRPAKHAQFWDDHPNVLAGNHIPCLSEDRSTYTTEVSHFVLCYISSLLIFFSNFQFFLGYIS